jgi:hypothetical protein
MYLRWFSLALLTSVTLCAIAQPTTKPATSPKAAQPPAPVLGPADTPADIERQYRERITKDRLDGVYIPKNLEEAIAELDKKIAPEMKGKIRAIPEDTVYMLLRYRLGQWMISNWSFYEGSRLSHYLRSAGVTYPDDMAEFLLIAYHRHLNNKPFSIKDASIQFRQERRAEFEKEQQSGKVIEEKSRIRPKPATSPAAGTTTAPATAKPLADPTNPPATTAPKQTTSAPPTNTTSKPTTPAPTDSKTKSTAQVKKN